MTMQVRILAAALAVASFGSLAGAAALTISGFSENFNSLGASGTTPPASFSLKVGPSGTSNTTWVSSIPASGVAALIATSGPLTATATYPSVTNNNGFNAPAYNGVTPVAADRALALSPTTVSGAAIELTLTNSTAFAQPALNLSYDIERYSSVSTTNELPGYWLFYSLNGTSWTEAANFRSTITTVPNTVGSATVTGTLTLSSSLAVGSTVLIRWVDDNAAQTSPDQIIGLDNVVVTPTVIPEPTALAALLPTVALISRRRR